MSWHPRSPARVIARVVARYRAGVAVSILAADAGVSKRTIHTWLRASGVPLRPLGRPRTREAGEASLQRAPYRPCSRCRVLTPALATPVLCPRCRTVDAARQQRRGLDVCHCGRPKRKTAAECIWCGSGLEPEDAEPARFVGAEPALATLLA